MLTLTFLQLLFFSALTFDGTSAFTSYANDFVDPDFILAKSFSPNTTAAQSSIIQWAQDLAAQGPWTVMNKSVTPPSGDKHDYMSWAPYSWPDCSKAGNTTELTPEQIWTTCPYYTRDGLFNPDGRLINDVGAFGNLADAVLYNAIAWVLKGGGSSNYSKSAVTFLSTWFLDDDTKMNPNLNYAQLARGPDGQTGQHTGVLDLKCFAKIASGILILRKGGSADWTTELDTKMNEWVSQYITWLETARIALEEGDAANNHGSFYYNQLAALKLLVNDNNGARNVTETFFSKQYMSQIEASGEQPLEAARTRPYHYRAYNLAAMITSARILKYAYPSSDVWNKTTNSGATIKSALDFAMTIPASQSKEDSYAAELYPDIAAVASVYGDPNDAYASFLQESDPTYAEQAYFLWNQPLAGGSAPSSTSNSAGETGGGDSDSNGQVAASNGGLATFSVPNLSVFAYATVSYLALLLYSTTS